MTAAYELALGREHLHTLIEFAIREGWQVRRTANGHLIFTKGSASIYTDSTPAAQGNGHG